MPKLSCTTIASILALAVVLPSVQAAGKAVNLSSERIQECKNAMHNIIKDYREGRDLNSNDRLRDQRLTALCNQAIAAHDAGVVASTAAAGTKGIKPEVLRHVLESANRIVTLLNEHGSIADYPAGDLRMVEKFKAAFAFVDCLAAGPACPRAHAKSIITQFNEHGANASFRRSDEQAIRQYHEEKGRNKQQN